MQIGSTELYYMAKPAMSKSKRSDEFLLCRDFVIRSVILADRHQWLMNVKVARPAHSTTQK